MHVEQLAVRRIHPAHRSRRSPHQRESLFERLVFQTVSGVAISLAECFGGVHSSAATVKWGKAREAEPRFIPEEYQVWLDGQAFLHDALRMIHVPVECAVGEIKHADVAELAGRFELQ